MSPNTDVADVVADRVADVVAAGVGRRFPTAAGSAEALVDVHLAAARGALTVIAGPSGSGKSTLLMILAAVDVPDEGTVDVNGVSLVGLSRRRRRAWRRDHLGLVLPQPSDNLTERRDAIGNLLWANSLRSGRPPLARNDAAAIMADLGLSTRTDASIPQLSGGEQMRLAVACAAVGEPAVVIADEPTASLDAAAAQTVITTLVDLARRAGVIVATHDRAVIDAADDVIRLDHGRRVS